jgi:hypothetical protein
MPLSATAIIKHWLSDIRNFSGLVIKLPLRQYQLKPADAILDSVLHGKGLTFAVMMCRQAGKNELSAQLEAYLLNLYRRRGGGIVKGSPTFKPQTVNSILRLSDRLNNAWNRKEYRRREGYIIQLGNARAFFFSADPAANVVGATASLLLEGDEVQDISQAKWDKDFTPMGASTNVTTVFYGTAWTSNTFLAQSIAFLKQQQAKDGIQRVFTVTADQVRQEVPAYGKFVDTQVARLGRNHPLVKTQFFLETIDGTGGLFPPARRALMYGDHPRRHDPEPGHRYAILVDVAGEDEIEGSELDRMMLANPRRDATAITIVDVELSPTAYQHAPEPRQRLYRTVDRQIHLGTRHTALYAKIVALAEHWHAPWIIVDATGVGAGLASFLVRTLGERVTPVEFSANVKSDIGWDFVAVVETGRYRDYIDDQAADTRQFWYELEACQYEISTGPGKRMKWGVWEAPAYDGLVARGHDDLLISAALISILDKLDVPGDAVGDVVTARDPLLDIDQDQW